DPAGSRVQPQSKHEVAGGGTVGARGGAHVDEGPAFLVRLAERPAREGAASVVERGAVVLVEGGVGPRGRVDVYDQRLARHLARVLDDRLPEDEGAAPHEDGD